MWRCHGIFNDQLEAVAPDGSFHFEKPLTVLERILDNGQIPFLELSGMPGALARTEESVCHYRFRSAPPRDWRRWEELVEQFLHVLIERFGREELCRWYFEVWNEPDLPFWTGTQEEYFKLYDLSRAAIKRQDSRFRVGGPATSKTRVDCRLLPPCLRTIAGRPVAGVPGTILSPRTPIRATSPSWTGPKEKSGCRAPIFCRGSSRGCGRP